MQLDQLTPPKRRTGAPPLRAKIDTAYSCWRLGARRAARQACATLMQDDLPAIVADPALLLRLVQVLILAEGFGQLTRLLRAACGVRIDFLPATGRGGGTGLLLASGEGKLTAAFSMDALRQPDAAALARRWGCDILQAVNPFAACR